MTLLKVEHLTKNFGGLSAVSNVSMTIAKGELIGLIGPNGAGKTTFFNLLTGVYEPSEGRVALLSDDGKEQVLNQLPPYAITNLGLARTFQNIRLFKNLTVLDNVLIAMHSKESVSLMQSLLRTKAYYQKEADLKQQAIDLLKLFKLEGVSDSLAKNLPYGDQRRLEIVRALASKPKILFLDEPAAGLNPQETEELTAAISMIREQFNLTVILIEHDMNLVMEICERIYVLEYGRLIAQGTPEEIRTNDAVIKAYLGGD